MKEPHPLETLMRRTAQAERNSLQQNLDHQLLLERIQREVHETNATHSTYSTTENSRKWRWDSILSGGFSPIQWIPFAAVFLALLVSLIALKWTDTAQSVNPSVEISQNHQVPEWIVEKAGPQEFTKIFTTAASLPGFVNDLGTPMENEWNLFLQDARIAMDSAISTLAPTLVLYQPLQSASNPSVAE